MKILLSLLLLTACNTQEAEEWCKTAKLCTCIYNYCKPVEH